VKTVPEAGVRPPTRGPEFYSLGRGVGYSREADERLGFRRLRKRLRKEVVKWLKVIFSWRFKDEFSGLRHRNQDIVIYVHVNESIHTVNEPAV
jgi:hypothetical protein